MVKKTLIGAAIVIFIGWILKDAFYKSLCEQGKFACSVGWIAFKSPSFIIAFLVGLSTYLYITKKE